MKFLAPLLALALAVPCLAAAAPLGGGQGLALPTAMIDVGTHVMRVFYFVPTSVDIDRDGTNDAVVTVTPPHGDYNAPGVCVSVTPTGATMPATYFDVHHGTSLAAFVTSAPSGARSVCVEQSPRLTLTATASAPFDQREQLHAVISIPGTDVTADVALASTLASVQLVATHDDAGLCATLSTSAGSLPAPTFSVAEDHLSIAETDAAAAGQRAACAGGASEHDINVTSTSDAPATGALHVTAGDDDGALEAYLAHATPTFRASAQLNGVDATIRYAGSLADTTIFHRILSDSMELITNGGPASGALHVWGSAGWDGGFAAAAWNGSAATHYLYGGITTRDGQWTASWTDAPTAILDDIIIGQGRTMRQDHAASAPGASAAVSVSTYPISAYAQIYTGVPTDVHATGAFDSADGARAVATLDYAASAPLDRYYVRAQGDAVGGPAVGFSLVGVHATRVVATESGGAEPAWRASALDGSVDVANFASARAPFIATIQIEQLRFAAMHRSDGSLDACPTCVYVDQADASSLNAAALSNLFGVPRGDDSIQDDIGGVWTTQQVLYDTLVWGAADPNPVRAVA